MLRRSALAFSSRRLSIGRAPRQTSTPQIFSCPRREFSSASSRPPSTGKNLSKVFFGSAAIGVCLYAAYSEGYLNDILGNKKQSIDISKVNDSNSEKEPISDGRLHDFQNIKDLENVHNSKDAETLNSHVKEADETIEKQSPMDLVGDPGKYEAETDSLVKNSSNMTEEASTHKKEEGFSKLSDDILEKGAEVSESSTEDTTKNANPSSQELFGDSSDSKSSGEKVNFEQHEENENLPTNVGIVVQESHKDEDEIDEVRSENELGNSLGALGDVEDSYEIKDGKLILDFLQAIHAAEQRQAELDARVFAEEKRAMKGKYEKELKDARARELMYAEEAAMLEKEIKKERAKAAAALKSLQERAEERLKKELEEKEKEAESKLKEAQDIAKAELAAAIAREKAAQIEKMAEANLNINALCMAFYARSEEARQTHSIHKLALGALALEDALSNGLPVQSELDALQVYIENVDKDSLLQLALSSIPEDVRLHGSDTILQLNQKFEALKGNLRHFSLIPPSGGGILAHSLAHVASFLKVKETDQSGDGIESMLNKVESLITQGNLREAADVLENGVKGSKATELANDWVKRARNRAIAEQALVLVQSYAASISLT
ncbi:unnamed protein product [Amaranthus hypochondriacus]